MAEPGEFTKRAFLHGRLDLTEAEAVMDLIRARSDRALEAARNQLRGALRKRVDDAVARLLSLCAAVEAQVDFPEEDLPAAEYAHWHQATGALAAELSALAATRREGDLLRTGVKIVLIGEPNAGKSSLLNRLVGFERAIVSDEPGTTRDFLEERIELGAWCARLLDTAGLRESGGTVERSGVRRTLEQMREADVVVLVTDLTAPPPTLPDEVWSRMDQAGAVIALNKCDQPRCTARPPAGVSATSIEVSALTGGGIPELRQVLESTVSGVAGGGLSDEGIVVNARHEASLRDAVSFLGAAASLLKGTSEPPLDLVAVEFRTAAEALGGIVGRIDHEEILDRLFASFCIGK